MPAHESTATLAYQLWNARGRPSGSDRQDWFEAQRQLAEPEESDRSAGEPPVDETDDAPATAPGDIGEGP